MILFLNRNDEEWPHTRQVLQIAGRNHILPPLVIVAHGKLNKDNRQLACWTNFDLGKIK